MTKRNSDNLRIKRKYLVWRKDSKGLSDASVDKSAAAISTYETFLNGKDFRNFHSERARSFKRHLSSQQNQRKVSHRFCFLPVCRSLTRSVQPKAHDRCRSSSLHQTD
jgi:hypothetical protein